MVIDIWPLTGEKKKPLSRFQMPLILDTTQCDSCVMEVKSIRYRIERHPLAIMSQWVLYQSCGNGKIRVPGCQLQDCAVSGHYLARQAFPRLIKRDFRKPMRTLAFTVLFTSGICGFLKPFDVVCIGG